MSSDLLSAPTLAAIPHALVEPQTAALPISVVMCTRDRPDTIARAVESVATQHYGAFDLLIVDQSRTDETRKIVEDLQGHYAYVRYMHLDQVGLSRAYNAGVRNTTGDILAFTDDDCVAPEYWLETISRSFADHLDVGLLYGQVLMPTDVALDSTKGTIPVLPFQRRRRLSRREGFQVFGMGANFALRRSTWEKVQGFDEILGGGGPLKSSQDFDFSYRVYLAGETILLEPEVFVYHYGFRSRTEWPATLKAYGIGDGAFYFKHVRAGDLYASNLLLRLLLLHAARELKHTIERGRAGAQWTYVRNVLVGMYNSLKFGVDRRNRLYVVRRAA